MLTLVTAQQALQQHANNTQVAAQDVEALLQNVKGVTFANIAYVTDVKLAAAHKHNVVQKVTVANVQLFNNLQAFTDVYVNAVKRTAAQIASNDAQNIADFEKQDSYFTHTNCYSVVQHKTNNNKYLFAIFNNAQSMYFINAQQATKQQVAALMQPAAAKKLLEDNALVHNVANNITHSVQVRTIALQNIVSITAQKQTLTV
jgi:hypothetical protein